MHTDFDIMLWYYKLSFDEKFSFLFWNIVVPFNKSVVSITNSDIEAAYKKLHS